MIKKTIKKILEDDEVSRTACADNIIKDEGARMIHEALKTNTALTWLSMWSDFGEKKRKETNH